MAYVDVVRTNGYEGGFYLEGTFNSGATVLWGNRPLQIAGAGVVQARLMAVGPVAIGIAPTWDAEMQLPSVSVTLDNADAELAPYCIGTGIGSDPSSEYGGDSFLNFTAILYHWALDASGAVVAAPVSPPLCCARSPSIGGTTVTLQLTGEGRGNIGRNRYGAVTLRMLRDSSPGAHGAGSGGIQTYYLRGGFVEADDFEAVTLTQTEFAAALAAQDGDSESSDLDRALPFLYGRTWFAALPLSLSLPISSGSNNASSRWAPLGVLVEEPSDFHGIIAEWSVMPREGPRELASPYGLSYIPGGLIKIKRDFVCEDGTTRALWVLLAQEAGRSWYRPPRRQHLGVPASRGSAPAAIIQSILSDLGPGGASVNATDFSRARTAQLRALSGGCGGALSGDVPLTEAISSLASAASMALWLDVNGVVRCLAYPGFSAVEVAAAAGTLPIIRDADVLAWDGEAVPTIDGERGGGATRVSIEWTRRQLEEMPDDGRVDRAFGRAVEPSVVDTESTIPGDWICPSESMAVLNHSTKHRARTQRRIHLTTRLWVATAYAPAQLFRLQTTLGRGGAGYEDRLVRLEATEVDLEQDVARCRFEDLGPIAEQKPCVLDDSANWIRHDPAGTGISLALSSASTTVTASGGTPFASAVAGDSLQTFGSANAGNRVSKKITVVTSSTQVTVESVYATTEAALAASAAATPLVDTAWCVMKTQSTKANTDKLTVCNEATQLFRDGATSGFVVTA